MSKNNKFEQVEEALDIEHIEEEKKIYKKDETKVYFNDIHDTDIKKDYEENRTQIKDNLCSVKIMLKRVEDAILEAEESDKFLTRKIEGAAALLKIGIDLRKELMTLHESRQTLLEIDEEDDENNTGNNRGTSSDIKSRIKANGGSEFPTMSVVGGSANEQ